MSTHRQMILDQIETMLNGIEENDSAVFKHVAIGEITPVDLDTVAFPAIFVFPGPEKRMDEVTDMEQWEWTIIFEVWAKDEDMEHLLGLLHTVMAKNNSDGGLICSTLMGVIHVMRMSSDMLVVDPDRSLLAMVVTFSVLYRHSYGQP